MRTFRFRKTETAQKYMVAKVAKKYQFFGDVIKKSGQVLSVEAAIFPDKLIN